LIALGSEQAYSQNPYWQSGYTPARSQPVVSPWLNMANGGSAALNYFNGVVPQRQFNNQINTLQAGLAANQQALLGLSAAAPLGVTGHPVQFMSFQQYFGTLGTSSSRTLGGRGTMPLARGTGGAALGTGLAAGAALGTGSVQTGSRIR